MTENGNTLTTGEFSTMTGIAVSTITQMLRQGKIKGEKRSGKWAIDPSETQSEAILSKKGSGKSWVGLGPIFDAAEADEKTYDVETFAQMTYLTEKGVRRWLAAGRLSGIIDTAGNRRVNASNLDRPEFQHLVRG